jgi:hypothetical protein
VIVAVPGETALIVVAEMVAIAVFKEVSVGVPRRVLPSVNVALPVAIWPL